MAKRITSYLQKSGKIIKLHSDGDAVVNFGGNNDASIDAKLLVKESVEEGTVAELNQEVETSYVGKGKSMYDAIQQVWEAAAQAKQGIAGKHQEKQKGDPQRHGQSQQMIADTDYDNPEVAADFKVGTDDVSKAGRVVTKQSPARGGADQLNVGDKKPVKGAK